LKSPEKFSNIGHNPKFNSVKRKSLCGTNYTRQKGRGPLFRIIEGIPSVYKYCSKVQRYLNKIEKPKIALFKQGTKRNG